MALSVLTNEKKVSNVLTEQMPPRADRSDGRVRYITRLQEVEQTYEEQYGSCSRMKRIGIVAGLMAVRAGSCWIEPW